MNILCIGIIISKYIQRFSSPTFLLVLYAVPTFALLILFEVIFCWIFEMKSIPVSKQFFLTIHLHSQAT